MSIEISQFAVLVPLAGVVVGALLQYWLSRSSKTRESLMQMRVQAYVDFITSSAELARLSKEAENRSEILAKRGGAKYRIAIYGSKSVVEKLAAFESSDKNRERDKFADRFLSLCEAMRKDSGSLPIDDPEILRKAIYGGSQNQELAKNA